jgi:hypothetical protein
MMNAIIHVLDHAMDGATVSTINKHDIRERAIG